MKEVDLSGINLDDDKAASLAACVHNIEVLNISDCKLTTNGIQCIAEAIEQRSTPVRNKTPAVPVTACFCKITANK